MNLGPRELGTPVRTAFPVIRTYNLIPAYKGTMLVEKSLQPTPHAFRKLGLGHFEITESMENKNMAYRVSLGKMAQGHVTYALEPVKEGTELTCFGNYELPWGIFGKFLGRLVGGMAEKETEQSLENLKSILEK